jgi:hypothetical protein
VLTTSQVQLDGHSTTPLTYLTDPNDENATGVWEEARDPLFQGNDLLPNNVVALTWGQVYGQWLLYDLESCRLGISITFSGTNLTST